MPGTKVRTENGPRKARTESTVHPRLAEGEQALVDCLENLAMCGHASWEAAHALKPVRQAVLSSTLFVCCSHAPPCAERGTRSTRLPPTGGHRLTKWHRRAHLTTANREPEVSKIPPTRATGWRHDRGRMCV